MPFGVSFRAALTALMAIPFIIVLSRVMGHLVPLFNAPDHWLSEGFRSIGDVGLTVAVLSALIMLVARAVIQSEVR